MAEKKKDEREGSGEQELAGAAAARGVENQAAKQAVALQRAQAFESSREQRADQLIRTANRREPR